MYRKTPAKFGSIGETAVPPLPKLTKKRPFHGEGPFSITLLKAVG
jgi:hypothetical protein